MAAVKSLCTRGIMMKNGKVNFIGDINDVIDNYLSDNTSLLENTLEVSTGVFDISKHKNKKVSDEGIIKASVFCNGVLSNTIYNGSQLDIVLEYKANRDFFSAEVGIVIKDKDEISYVGINNKHIGKELIINKGVGIVKISISDFPIYSDGKLYINLYLGDLDYSKYEILENAIVLKSETSDIYDSGKLLDIKWNKITIKELTISKL